MMTKYKLAEQVLRLLYPSGTSDAKPFMQEILLAVSQARDKVIRDDYFEKLALGEPSIPYQYVSVYDNNGLGYSVSYDSVRKKYYCQLPVRVIDLPKQRGFVEVRDTETEETLIPTSQTEIRMYYSMLGSDLDGEIMYYPERDRVYIINGGKEDMKISYLLVASGEDIDPLKDFMLPSNLEQQVVVLAAQLYSKQKEIPQDKVKNNISE